MAIQSSSHRPRAATESAQRGSTYLFVLLALLLLTVIGLSLVVVTQTEVQIGGAEKSATRILFGADSGLEAQLGLHFLSQNVPNGQFTLDTKSIPGSSLTEVVDVSEFYAIYAGPCALCSVNAGSDQYYVNNYAVNAQGKRLTSEGCTGTPQGVKLLSEMYLIQPEEQKGGGVTFDIREQDPTAEPSNLIGLVTCDTGLKSIRY
jgi:hypothetical protein